MLITSFAAGPWQANTYVVAATGASQCVVIDPGVEAGPHLAAALAEHGLSVGGVLLTHGHIDHVASAADVADAAGVPAWLHAADRELLTDAGPGLAPVVAGLGIDLREPADLRELVGGEPVEVAGLVFDVVHAPGHRPGCVMLRLPLPASAADPGRPGEAVFTGDVLFAGSIGRTDLPGGDPDAMVATLRHALTALPDDALLLPGHGAATTMAVERSSNPYLQSRFLSQP